MLVCLSDAACVQPHTQRSCCSAACLCYHSTASAELPVHLLLLTQVTGDDTTVIQAVLACDTERTQLLKEEQTLLKQLNKEAPDQTHATTANGHSATANGTAATPNGSSATAAESGATAADARDSNGAGSGDAAAVDGKAAVGKAADAAESKAAAQLAQVHSMDSVLGYVQICDEASSSLVRAKELSILRNESAMQYCIHQGRLDPPFVIA